MASGIVSLRFEDDVLFIEIAGYADGSLMEEVFAGVIEWLEKDCVSFVFNLEGMTLINSTALGVMIEIISEGLGNESIGFYFCAIPSACRLGILGVGLLNHVCECASVEDAVKRIQIART